MASPTQESEIWTESKTLKDEHTPGDNIYTVQEQLENGAITDGQREAHNLRFSPKKKSACHKRWGLMTRLVPTVLLLAAVMVIVFMWGRLSEKNTLTLAEADKVTDTTAQEASFEALVAPRNQNKLNLLSKLTDGRYIKIAQRNDYLLQECHGTELKRSFPDLDYALKGYNILRGYPLATGHDPGFTFPVFEADYSEGRHTGDCRYSVPRGLVVTPDVSCVVSFISKIIQTQAELTKSLSVSANVKGSGWGVSFSASAGYKRSSSSISSGDTAYILSTASCKYYYSQVIPNRPPGLDPAFVNVLRRLNAKPDNSSFFAFFESYGTHYLSESTFGARYVRENKMSSSKLATMTKNGVNVAVSASYSAMGVSGGGGFEMDQERQEKASEFQKEVETTVITIGAPPPATGDAQQWVR